MQKKRLFILIIFIFILLCSMLNIAIWYIDNFNSNKILSNIKDTTKVNTINNTDNIEIINPDNNLNSQYWKHVNENLINVDIKKLKKENNDIIGWINVKGSNINYPFVQTNNNSYYLNHSINKKKNSVGSIFLDYRNNINESSKNNILYGHARKDKTMFGSLKFLLKKEWLNNKNNHLIKISTEKENSLWQIYSIYYTKTNSYLITTNFKSDNDFKKYIDTTIDNSIYNFNYNVNINDTLLTLSTCYSQNRKLLVHAKLIKIEKKTN